MKRKHRLIAKNQVCYSDQRNLGDSPRRTRTDRDGNVRVFPLNDWRCVAAWSCRWGKVPLHAREPKLDWGPWPSCEFALCEHRLLLLLLATASRDFYVGSRSLMMVSITEKSTMLVDPSNKMRQLNATKNNGILLSETQLHRKMHRLDALHDGYSPSDTANIKISLKRVNRLNKRNFVTMTHNKKYMPMTTSCIIYKKVSPTKRRRRGAIGRCARSTRDRWVRHARTIIHRFMWPFSMNDLREDLQALTQNEKMKLVVILSLLS